MNSCGLSIFYGITSNDMVLFPDKLKTFRVSISFGKYTLPFNSSHCHRRVLKFSRREEGSDLGFPNLEVADIEYREMKGHLSSMKLLINDTDTFEFCLNPVFTSTDHLHVPLKKW